MGHFKSIDLSKVPDDKDITNEQVYNLSACVPWNGVGKVSDPFEGSSKMPGTVRVPFDPEDYDNRAASLEREAAKQYFNVSDFTTMREPTPDEVARTKLNGIVLLNLETAAWCRAYAAQLRNETVRVHRDSVADERAKAKRLAERKHTQLSEQIAEMDTFLRLHKNDIAEGRRLKQVLRIAETAANYEAQLPTLRHALEAARNEIERNSSNA